MTLSNAGMQGIRPGVVTSTTRPTAPYNGMLIYETDTKKVYIRDGSNWVEQPTAGMVDAKGDLLVGTAADAASRLAVGTNGQVLSADSTQPTGIRWTNISDISTEWIAWTPAWSSSGTQPSLGNATVYGRYTKVQRTVIAQGYIIFGSTSTYGTNAYLTSLPVAQRVDSMSNGFATLLDVSAGAPQYVGTSLPYDTNRVEWRLGNAATNWQPTVPITLASGDQFRFTVIYEATA